ncbi:MAG TPA: TIGR00730 family Rossman fold protein [Chloroflexota bacterium]
MNGVCVFCGSSPGANHAYLEAATEVGGLLARRGLTLVYGGGRVGVMGAAADAALAAGGRVIGVIPQSLVSLEVAHLELTELRVVNSMHERKALMGDLSDAFLVLPGGLGTMEEFFEVATWSQLGIHNKPVGLLNVAGYYDTLLAFMEHALSEGFIPPRNRDLVMVDGDAASLLDRMAAYHGPARQRWLDERQR